MFKKRILLIGNEGVVLFGPSPKGGIEREAAISWEAPNFKEQMLLALNKKNQSASVLLLFDQTDQTYKEEKKIPKLTSADRQKYVKRKLDQAFASYPIKTSIEIKSKEKKEPSYMFIALTDTEKLDQVIACLLDFSAPISGFGLVPLEAQGLIGFLAKKLFEDKKDQEVTTRWEIIVGQNETGGLRQIVSKNGMLALTRMTPPSEAGVKGEAWVDNVIEEFKATETYLSRVGLSADDSLSVIVVCGESEKEHFKAKEFMKDRDFKAVTAVEVLELLGYKNNILSDTDYADPLYAAWLSKNRLKTPIRIPSLYNIMMPRLASIIGAAVFFLGVLALIWFNFDIYQQYVEVQETIVTKNSQKASLDRQYREEDKLLKAFPVKIEDVRAALAVDESIKGSSLDVSRVLNVFRAAIDKDIKIKDFQIAYDESALASKQPASRGRTRNAEKPKGGVVITFKFAVIESLTLEERVIRAEQVLERVKEVFKGYDVKLLNQFGNISREGSFAGKTEDGGKANISKADTAAIEIKGALP